MGPERNFDKSSLVVMLPEHKDGDLNICTEPGFRLIEAHPTQNAPYQVSSLNIQLEI